MTQDYVKVRDEPFHRRRFENEWVRVYDALIPAGTTTLYHEHDEDTVYVAVSEASFRSCVHETELIREGTLPAGNVGWRPHRTEPLIHEVRNAGDNDMRLIGMEVKASPAVTSPDLLIAPGYELVVEQERIRGYMLTLDAGASTGDVSYGFSSATVMLSTAVVTIAGPDSAGHTMILATGDVIWQPPARFSMQNVGEAPLKAALVEWR